MKVLKGSLLVFGPLWLITLLVSDLSWQAITVFWIVVAGLMTLWLWHDERRRSKRSQASTSGPMTPDQLDRIERQLGIRLPSAYRDVMQSYPFDDESFAVMCMLSNDAEHLIAINQEPDLHFRLHHRKGGWVPNRDDFQIGSDGGETLFFLDLREDPAPVHQYDLETGELTRYAEDIGAYVRRCHEIDAEIAEDEHAVGRG